MNAWSEVFAASAVRLSVLFLVGMITQKVTDFTKILGMGRLWTTEKLIKFGKVGVGDTG